MGTSNAQYFHQYYIARACLQDVGLRSLWETQGHNIARVCPQAARLGNPGKLKASTLPEYASEMPGWEASGELKAMACHCKPDYASQITGWGTPGKETRMILQEYASEMPGWETLGNLETITLSEYVSEIPGWTKMVNLKP